MDITQNEVSLQKAYGVLDQIRDIIPIAQADFKVRLAGSQSQLPPDQVAAMKQNHNQLVAQLQQIAKNFPIL